MERTCRAPHINHPLLGVVCVTSSTEMPSSPATSVLEELGVGLPPPTAPPRSRLAKKRYWLLAGTAVLVVYAFAWRGWVDELLTREESRSSLKGGSRESRTAAAWGGAAAAANWWAARNAGASAGVSGGGGVSTECSDPDLARAEYSPLIVQELLNSATISSPGAWPAGAWHSRVDPTCPKFISPSQNYNAGIGHRTVAYTMALHTAMWWNLTFVHTSLDGGGGAHGNYNGWDSWLGFTTGELGFDDVLKRPGLTRVKLPGLSGGYYTPNEKVIAEWRGALMDPALCNVLYYMPLDQ